MSVPEQPAQGFSFGTFAFYETFDTRPHAELWLAKKGFVNPQYYLRPR